MRGDASLSSRSQVAQVQQLVCLGCLAVAAGVAAHDSLVESTSQLIVQFVATPVLMFFCVLGVQFALSVVISRRAGRRVELQPALLAAWWREVWVAIVVFGWRQPWAWRKWSDNCGQFASAGGQASQSDIEKGRRGVVLVHGFMCNRGLWNRWRRELAACGVPTVAVNLEPFRGSIDEYVPIIERAVQELTCLTGLQPVVVAHSMGGLATRAWLSSAPDNPSRVAHVVTIGTPHHGTWLARWGFAANARQMRLDSVWLRQLEAKEASDLGALFTCWHSCADNIVFPVGTAVLPGSAERYLPNVGHVALVDHPAIRQDVLSRLKVSPP